jgi:hypothetical protein
VSRGRKLAIVGALLVLAALLVGALVLWRVKAPELRARGKAAVHEGIAFAKGRDAEACLAEATRRLEGISWLGEAENKSFLASCLRTARPDAALCADLPPRSDAHASARWARALCNARHVKETEPCVRLIGALQRACITTATAPTASP